MKSKRYFCQQEMEINKLSDGLCHGVCPDCPEIARTIFDLAPDMKTLRVWCAIISFKDNDKEYEAVYCPPSDFYLNEIKYAEADNFNIAPRVRVMQLTFCPKNITPHNIKQKFPTLKVWS